MSRPLRNGLTFLAVFVVSLWISVYLTSAWSSWFLIGRTFTSRSVWWSQAHLLDSMDEFLLMLLAGAILCLALRVRRPIVWALLLGVAFAIGRWSLGWNWIAPDADVSVYFWAYTRHVLPVLGSIVGASLAAVFRARLSRRAVA